MKKLIIGMLISWKRHEGDILKAKVPEKILRSCTFDAINVDDKTSHGQVHEFNRPG